MRKVGTQNWGGEEADSEYSINKASADPQRMISGTQMLLKAQHEFKGSWIAEKNQSEDHKPWIQTT